MKVEYIKTLIETTTTVVEKTTGKKIEFEKPIVLNNKNDNHHNISISFEKSNNIIGCIIMHIDKMSLVKYIEQIIKVENQEDSEKENIKEILTVLLTKITKNFLKKINHLNNIKYHTPTYYESTANSERPSEFCNNIIKKGDISYVEIPFYNSTDKDSKFSIIIGVEEAQ